MSGINNPGYVPRKFSTTLQLGSFFTSAPGYGNSFSTFVNPEFSYAVNPKLRINAGISLINTTLYDVKPWFYNGREQSMNGNYMHAILSVGADYMVNDRLSLSGYMFKDIDLYNEVESSSPYKRINPEGGYLKVGYKVSDHFRIEGGVGYSKGINPYGSYYGSPFAPSIFPY
jgi:hypothetical protein